MSKPKRYYHRPPYKKMWQAMNDENEGLRLEMTNLRKENKSLKMELEAYNQVTCTGNVSYGNSVYSNPLSPTPYPSLLRDTDQPKHRTWWERLWGLT